MGHLLIVIWSDHRHNYIAMSGLLYTCWLLLTLHESLPHTNIIIIITDLSFFLIKKGFWAWCNSWSDNCITIHKWGDRRNNSWWRSLHHKRFWYIDLTGKKKTFNHPKMTINIERVKFWYTLLTFWDWEININVDYPWKHIQWNLMQSSKWNRGVPV